MIDDMTTFDRQIAAEFLRDAGPSEPVSDAAIFAAITATTSVKWSFGSMFSTTRSVVVAAIVALLAGSLIIAQYATPPIGTPGADSGEAGTFSPAGSPTEPNRWGSTATLLPDGRVLVVGGEDDHAGAIASAEIWDPNSGTFSPTGSLAEGRIYPVALLLPDERVLIVGGSSTGNGHRHVALAEVWDPTTGMFSPAGTFGSTGYVDATLLPDGRVLVVGGGSPTAEIWDPETDAFTPAGSLTEPRTYGHTATLLPDGRVLVVGGGTPLAEVWDPETDAFSPAGSLAEPQVDFTTTVLPDGRVFVAGYSSVLNEDGAHEYFTSPEVWDPATSTFSAAGSPAMSWIEYATLLPDGRVLVLGGGSEDGGDPYVPNVAEVWDPATGTFSTAGSAATRRDYATATLLPDGRVLIVGGCIGDQCEGGSVDQAEIWDPATSSFSPAGSLSEPGGGSATLLPDGRVLTVGGETAEVWAPSGE